MNGNQGNPTQKNVLNANKGKMELTKQKKYCEEKGYPMFAPLDGICWHCHKQFEDTDKWVITGCSHCHRSYDD